MIPTSQFQRRRPKKKSSELNSVCGDIIFRWVFVSSSIFCNTCAVRTTHWVRARHTKFYKYYILMLLRQAWGSSIEYRHSFLLLSECYLHNSAMNFSNYWAEAHRPQLKCYIVSFYGEWKACTFKWSSIFRTRFPLCIPYDVVVWCVWRCQRCDKFQWNVLSTRYKMCINYVVAFWWYGLDTVIWMLMMMILLGSIRFRRINGYKFVEYKC